MSEVFQGVLLRGTPTDAAALLGPFSTGTLVVTVVEGVTVVCPQLGPDRELDALVGSSLAATASRGGGDALHVMYDSRIGFRHAQIFRKGDARQAFGFQTEFWFALGSDGEPLRDTTYATDELLDAEEYETAEDALTQGLQALGVRSLRGSDLVQLVCYSADGPA